MSFDPHLRRRLLASIAAGVAGFALNCFPLRLAGGTPLAFGEVFSLLIALTLGPSYGLLTAMLTELPMLVLCPGGGVLITHVLEACAVGILVRRRMLPLSASAMFWVLVGAPVIILFGHTREGVPPTSCGRSRARMSLTAC